VELEGLFVDEEELVGVSPDSEEAISSSSANAAFGSRMSSLDEHPQNKHTTPTHPKNVVIFFMPVNIVYILALN
jgi:hypothetical protein